VFVHKKWLATLTADLKHTKTTGQKESANLSQQLMENINNNNKKEMPKANKV